MNTRAIDMQLSQASTGDEAAWQSTQVVLIVTYDRFLFKEWVRRTVLVKLKLDSWIKKLGDWLQGPKPLLAEKNIYQDETCDAT